MGLYRLQGVSYLVADFNSNLKINKMKKYQSIILFLLSSCLIFTGCKKYLDINSDPDTPQFPDPSSVFPTQLAAIPRGLQFDARYVSRWVQNFGTSDASRSADINWDRMGYVTASDANGDIWRQTYFGLGLNLTYIINEGLKNKQWDYVGAAYALQAMMYQYCTDYHGEMIFREAFKDQIFFKYDDQETVYKGIDSICRLSISYLGRTDGSAAATKLAKGDFVYDGNTGKWIKFVYGILARNYHHLSNKSSYNADSVINFCNKSLAVVQDDFLIPFDAQKNDDANFFGTFRDNLTFFRQSNYIVKLLDGTILTGSSIPANRDPRMKHMLAASHDTTNGNGGYRGVDPGIGDPNNALANWWTYAVNSTNYINARRKVAAPWGDTLYTNPSRSNFSTNFRKYLFGDKVVMPIMTASEIQFIKAEALLKQNNKGAALAAYKSGIQLHFDFINRAGFPRGNNQLFNQNTISPSEISAYLNGPAVRQVSDSLRIGDVLLQKYISLWGWGFFETWTDMRRYHYIDVDPANGQPYYRGFALPATLATENLGKLVYRVRPRFNSEYVWNRDELQRLGALNGDYHTYEMWFSQP
jgi:hypothetical protein